MIIFITCAIAIVFIVITALIYIFLIERKINKHTNALIEQAKDEIEKLKKMEERK